MGEKNRETERRLVQRNLAGMNNAERLRMKVDAIRDEVEVERIRDGIKSGAGLTGLTRGRDEKKGSGGGAKGKGEG